MSKHPSITARQVLDLIKQQKYRCAISGRLLTPETASLDHIVPVARGGQHCLSNIWVVHSQINAAKGTMTIDEFLSVCREVSDFQTKKATDQKILVSNENTPVQ